MSEENKAPVKKFPLSKVLRYSAFAILLFMLVSSLIYQMSNPNATDEERIEATVQAGVNQGLTEVSMQTGTPDPTVIQGTVSARIEATLTAVPDTPDISDADSTNSDNPLMNILNALLSPFRAMWDFAGLGGIWVQVICCIVPVLLLIVGIAND